MLISGLTATLIAASSLATGGAPVAAASAQGVAFASRPLCNTTFFYQIAVEVPANTHTGMDCYMAYRQKDYYRDYGPVHRLQDVLRNCNQHRKEIISDGEFGDKTLKAVIDFQKANGLTPDGNVGPATKYRMEWLQHLSMDPSDGGLCVRLH